MMKRVIFYSLVFLIITCEPIVYSFFNPGKIEILDDIRLNIQSEIMAAAGNYIIDDFSINKQPKNESKNAINLKELKKYTKKLQPGDLIFTDSEKYISSEIIPGKRKHSAIYLGTKTQIKKRFRQNIKLLNILNKYFITGNEVLILDSQSDGVKVRELKDLSNLKNKSLLVSILSFRINNNIEDFLKYTLDQIGKEYDYDLITNDTNKLYCSELIFEGLKKINIEINIHSNIYGRPVILANDEVKYIVNSGIKKNEFQIIFFLEKENGKLKEKSLKNL